MMPVFLFERFIYLYSNMSVSLKDRMKLLQFLISYEITGIIFTIIFSVPRKQLESEVYSLKPIFIPSYIFA